MKKTIQIEVDIPDGYEATGEYRKGKKGEHIINPYGVTTSPHRCEDESWSDEGPMTIILRRVEPKYIQACRSILLTSGCTKAGGLICTHQLHAQELAKQVIADWESTK